MAEARNYAAGDMAALMSLARGGCYKPGCGVPIVVEVEPNRWVLNVQRAHIAALNEGGPRHGQLPGVDLNSFGNLVLLCVPHHLLIDKLEPDRFSVKTLLTWKRDREKDGQAALAGLTNVTEERLQNLVAGAIEGYHEKVEALIERIEGVDLEMARMLRGLSAELADFRSVQYAADPDVAEMLATAANRLPSYDYAETLLDAAQKLSGLNERLVGQLQEAAETLARATRNLPEY